MKKFLLVLPLVFSLVFNSCPLDGGGSGGTGGGSNGTGSSDNGAGSNDSGTGSDSSGNSTSDSSSDNSGGENTRVVFDNTAGSCSVTVYESSERTETVKIAEVVAGTSGAGAVSEYKLFVNGTNIDFSGVDGDFEGGRIYTFVFSGASFGEIDLSLKSITAITPANVFMGQGANKEYSFTTWRDKKTDAGTGETVTGNNAIVFYADSAKLTGPYWQHPGGDFDYNGQILESYFSEGLDSIVIWTLKSERIGYLLKMQADKTLQVSMDNAVPHPFYKQ